MSDTPVFTDLDYAKDGKQIGTLFLPHSVNRSAYGNICVPIAVIRNGPGPTALFMAGTHGDEYEGQVALSRLIRDISPSEISGRIILMPAVNLPAAVAGARVSPIDQGNLNRAYPGRPDGTPTQVIAHYIESVLIPMADLLQDFHSGGASLDYLPMAAFQFSGDAGLDEKAMAALCAFGAPLSLRWSRGIGTGLVATAAARHGVVTIGGEFGGAGSVSKAGLDVVMRGIRGVLAHLGILASAPGGGGTRFVEIGGRDYYAVTPEAGVMELAVDLGEQVEAGQLCALIHSPESPERHPLEVRFRRTGLVICKRPMARVERGDVLAHLATDF
jgi:predicted deacylase